MARYTGPIVKQSRREGVALHPKVNLERRKTAPGQHGKRMRKASEYQVQLREKQKLKRYYGVLERQFRNYYQEADRLLGVTGEILVQLLERRLDNTVFRMGFAASRQQARQLVGHNHFLINGKKVNIPSYLIKPGDEITVKPGKENKPPAIIVQASQAAAQEGYPSWVKVDPQNLKGSVVRMPERSDLDLEVQERLIVEFYSR